MSSVLAAANDAADVPDSQAAKHGTHAAFDGNERELLGVHPLRQLILVQASGQQVTTRKRSTMDITHFFKRGSAPTRISLGSVSFIGGAGLTVAVLASLSLVF